MPRFSRLSWLLAGLLVACGPSESKPDPKTGSPVGTTPSTGVPGGTPTGTATGVTTTPARGVLITGIDPAMSYTDCSFDPDVFYPDAVTWFGSQGWEIRTGGPLDALIFYYFGPYLTPEENFWGGSIRSALYGFQDIPVYSYGYEVDANMEMAATAGAIPYTDAFVQNGLARGYYGVALPFLLGVPGGGGWDSGIITQPGLYDPADVFTVTALFGVDDTGALAPITFGVDTVPPSLILRVGGNGWNGDEQATDQFCEVVFYLDGIQPQPL